MTVKPEAESAECFPYSFMSVSISALTSRNSKVPLTQSMISKLHDALHYRCAICMTWIQTSQCAHIIDAASAGLQQVCNDYEVMELDYDPPYISKSTSVLDLIYLRVP